MALFKQDLQSTETHTKQEDTSHTQVNYASCSHSRRHLCSYHIDMDKYISFFNYFYQFKESDIKTLSTGNVITFCAAFILFLVSKNLGLRIFLVLYLILYFAVLSIIGRWDEKRYFMRRFLQRIISIGALSILLFLDAIFWYWRFVGIPVIFAVTSFCALVGLWVLTYKITKKALIKNKFKLRNAQSGTTFGPGFFAAFGVLGVFIGRVVFKGMDDSQWDFIIPCLIIVLTFLLSFEGQDLFAIELLLKNPGLDEECWKAREELKEKGQGNNTDQNP